MDEETRYFGLSAPSKHTIDLHIDVEDESEEEEGDLKQDYVCPFCLEDFDLVGFCCHIDSGHSIEAKSGICPICAKRVGINMAVHIITQHGSILKISFKKKLRGGGSHSISTLALLRKISDDEHLETFVEESSRVVSSSNMTADSLLSSFIYNPLPADEPESLHSSFTTEAKFIETGSDNDMLARHPSPLPNKDEEEKTQRLEFIQGLLYSTIFRHDF
ncbi:Protein DEHYDRATION-INDUCED 19 like [Actinidia chinensis var. chinensis]|uniref:Protein DEHYDRATION-INDUCED 19 like n=1 Tax=Actinidia chinensis var. chinensis TaxID=1590841 RepID=A0A2R6P5T2_ACTCC|nr:Protein DEHYDRATION-INDUCED 19 like [Actinidia chinensis var. chinensis]